MLRQLTENDVTFKIKVEQYYNVPPAHVTSGDNQLNNGDVWIWKYIKVIARYKNYSGWAGHGCYDYNENQFKECDYYQTLKSDALKDLNEKLNRRYMGLQELVE